VAAEEWYEVLLAKGLVPNKETYGKLSEAAAWQGVPGPPWGSIEIPKWQQEKTLRSSNIWIWKMAHLSTYAE